MGFYLAGSNNGDGGWFYDGTSLETMGSPLYPGSTSYASSLGVARTDGGFLWAILSSRSGPTFAATSEDGGITWVTKGNLFPDGNTNNPSQVSGSNGIQVIALDHLTCFVLYLGYYSGYGTNNYAGIWKSVDGGATWTYLVNLNASAPGFGWMAIGTSKLWHSVNTGANTFQIHRCNLDASAAEVITTITTTAAPANATLGMHAVDDNTVVAHRTYGVLWQGGAYANNISVTAGATYIPIGSPLVVTPTDDPTQSAGGLSFLIQYVSATWSTGGSIVNFAFSWQNNDGTWSAPRIANGSVALVAGGATVGRDSAGLVVPFGARAVQFYLQTRSGGTTATINGLSIWDVRNIGSIATITSAGVVTEILPTDYGLRHPYDVLILDSVTWIASGNRTEYGDVAIYKTTNAGASWSLMQVIPAVDGYLWGGGPAFSPNYGMWPDTHHPVMARYNPVTAATAELVMTGRACGFISPQIPQALWRSSNQGATWTKTVTSAQPRFPFPVYSGVVRGQSTFYLLQQYGWGFVYGGAAYSSFREDFTLPAVNASTAVKVANPGELTVGYTVMTAVGACLIMAITGPNWPPPSTITDQYIPDWTMTLQNTGYYSNQPPGAVAPANSVITNYIPYGGTPGDAWSQFARNPAYQWPPPEPAGIENFQWLYGLAASGSGRIYAAWVDEDWGWTSGDAGASWTRGYEFGTSPSGSAQVQMDYTTSGRLFVATGFTSGGAFPNEGMYYSDDHGMTFTKFRSYAGLPGPTNGNTLSCGDTKLWFAEQTLYVYPNLTGFTLYRCNFDGSGIETMGTLMWNTGSYQPSARAAGGQIVLRAFGDDFCLGTYFLGYVWQHFRIDSSGIHDLTPPADASFGPYSGWDAIPLGPSSYLLAGANLTTNVISRVYKTTDGGTTWMPTRDFGQFEGFAYAGVSEQVYNIDCNPLNRNQVYLLGHADDQYQQIVWYSGDGGVTWSAILNRAEARDVNGDWAVYDPGGIRCLGIYKPPLPKAIPSRLATIVG